MEHWRLEGDDEKLTLMDDIRVKMGRQVVKFFEYLTVFPIEPKLNRINEFVSLLP